MILERDSVPPFPLASDTDSRRASGRRSWCHSERGERGAADQAESDTRLFASLTGASTGESSGEVVTGLGTETAESGMCQVGGLVAGAREAWLLIFVLVTKWGLVEGRKVDSTGTKDNFASLHNNRRGTKGI